LPELSCGTIVTITIPSHYTDNETHFFSQMPVGGNPMLFNPQERGQGLVEYALILVLVAVVVIAVLTLLGPAIGNVFSTIKSNFG
jgi:pilus assembly protein Flp/PilA